MPLEHSLCCTKTLLLPRRSPTQVAAVAVDAAAGRPAASRTASRCVLPLLLVADWLALPSTIVGLGGAPGMLLKSL